MSQKPNLGRAYAKWSTFAIQGVAVIIGLLFLGRFIDQHYNLAQPICTISGILLGVFYFFDSLFKTINSERK